MKLKLFLITACIISVFINNIAFAECPAQTITVSCSESECSLLEPKTSDWKISDFHDIIGDQIELNFGGAIWENGNTDCYYATKKGKILVIRNKEKNPEPKIAETEDAHNKWKEYNNGQFLVCGRTHDITECPF